LSNYYFIIVIIFGTTTNRKSFYKNRKLYTNTKNSLLRRAYRKYEIVDIGDGKYEILRKREIELPHSFYDLNNGLYKYLTPMILKKILYDYNEDNSLVVTKFRYAHNIGMINNNYTLIKKYKTSAVEKYNFEKNNICDYYKYVDTSIKYYLENTLDKLKKCGVIDYEKRYAICYKKIKNTHNMSKMNIDFKVYYKPISNEENRIYNDLEQSTMKELEINTLQEAYFSKKSSKFKKRLKEELMDNPVTDENGDKIIMLLKFEEYRIWYTTIEKCENLLKEFNSESMIELIKNFNNEFIEKTLQNMENRNKDNDEKLYYDYKVLSDLTLNWLVEDINLNKDLIVNVDNENNHYNLQIIKDEY